MEVQFHFSIKIHDHVRAKLLALLALVSMAGAIVGVQVAVPHMAPAISCILLCGLFGYATLPHTHYRAEHGTFEEYCNARWGMERRHAYRLIDAAAAVENVSHGTHTLPTSERQARPLTQLPPEIQPIVWQQAVDTANKSSKTRKPKAAPIRANLQAVTA